MPSRLFVTLLLMAYGSFGGAAEIKGQVKDEQGTALKGVRLCLSVPGAAPGDCVKTRFTNKNGDYAFKGLSTGDYVVSVLTDTSLAARKADPYPNLAWAPVTREPTLSSRSQRVEAADFTGSFSFSNFQAEFQLTGSDFPELGAYDVANDYVFLKLFAINDSSGEQDLIFLGQVTDVGNVLIEVSVPLSTEMLFYEIYSANVPQSVIKTINLTL